MSLSTALTLMAPRDPARRIAYLNGALAAMDHLRDAIGGSTRQTSVYLDRRREVMEARDAILPHTGTK